MIGHAEDGFCTKPTAHGTSGRGGAVLVFAPPSTAAGSGRFGNHPRLPARHDNGGNGVCTGFPGCFSFWERLRRVVAGVAERLLLLLCAGELNGSAGNSSPVNHHSQATGAATTAQEGRPGPAQKLPPTSRQHRKKWGPPPT